MMTRANVKSKELMTKIDFQFDCNNIGSDKCIIDICPQKIRAYWLEKSYYQRSPNVTSYKHDLPWDAEPKRLASLAKASNIGVTIPPIDIHTGHKWVINFPDGRHRAIIAMINNHSVIKAVVNTAEKEYILSLLAVPIDDQYSGID